MNRAERRRHSKVQVVMKQHGDNCSLCGRPFKHLGVQIIGHINGKFHCVSECCQDKMKWAEGVGIFYALEPEPPYKKDDRLWFKQNPTRSHRVREIFKEEIINSGYGIRADKFAPVDATGRVGEEVSTEGIEWHRPEVPDEHPIIRSWVAIRQNEPGVRQKVWFMLPDDIDLAPLDEELSRALFEVVSKAKTSQLPIKEVLAYARTLSPEGRA
jgi:hypothetical protein